MRKFDVQFVFLQPSCPCPPSCHISLVFGIWPFMYWLPLLATATQPPFDPELLFLQCRRIHYSLLYRCRLTLSFEYPQLYSHVPYYGESVADLDQTPQSFKSQWSRSTTGLSSRFCGCRSPQTALPWTSPMQMPYIDQLPPTDTLSSRCAVARINHYY